jgi:hypothetical protein
MGTALPALVCFRTLSGRRAAILIGGLLSEAGTGSEIGRRPGATFAAQSSGRSRCIRRDLRAPDRATGTIGRVDQLGGWGLRCLTVAMSYVTN